LQNVASVLRDMLSKQNRILATAYREVLDLRDQVRKAERAATKSVELNGSKPTKRGRQR
jgi:hypothetical protein